MTDQATSSPFDPRDLVPENWFSTTEGSSIWIRGYQIHRVGQDVLATPVIKNLGDVVLIAFYGSLKYLEGANIKFFSADKWLTSGPVLQDLPEGAYLLLIAPFSIHGREGNESEVRQRLDEIGGLLIANSGRNSVFNIIFDNNILDMSGNNVSVIGPPIEHPLYFPPPDLSDQRWLQLSEMDKSLSLLSENERNRVKLSLRWYADSTNKIGADSFLSLWIALEILGMDKHGDLEPLNKLLSEIYNISVDDAEKKFRIKRISGLRAKIVHQGEFVGIHQDLSKYLEALYTDMLLAKLQLTSELRAQTILDEPGFDLNAYL